MSTRTLAWGVTGGVSLLVSLACSGKVNEVGKVDSAGSASIDTTGGTKAGSFSSAGRAGWSGAGGVGGDAGRDPICQTAGGSLVTDINGKEHECGSAPPIPCFAFFNGDPTGDIDLKPRSGPNNAVFVDAHGVGADAVTNHADQTVFPELVPNGHGVWEAYANFPASELAADTTIALPNEISRAPANLGQLNLMRPSCAGLPAAGHKLTVEVWWKLGGAVVGFPTHGLALGTVSKNKPVWFDDTVHTFVKGEPEGKRFMNTLNRIVLEHTFADDDETDAGQITLGLWLLPDSEFSSTFYVGITRWD